MPFVNHGRVYDLVIFGASGYTGAKIAEHITKTYPTNLKWALAGRSQHKLISLATQLKGLNPDRLQPAIETVTASVEDLSKLATKTFVLIATVGPYYIHGEPAFQACAEAGTHYFDVTGEVPFVAHMIKKYGPVAKTSGALMFTQCGLESVPPDLVVWLATKVNRTELKANTSEITMAMTVKGTISGGTLTSILQGIESIPLREIRQIAEPFSLSPVPKDNPRRGRSSLEHALTGVHRDSQLGLLATSITGTTDASMVERTWGLLCSTPSRQDEAYGPNFSFSEYVWVPNRLSGFILHWGFIAGAVLLYTLPPLRWLIKRFSYQPGEGASKEVSSNDKAEFRCVGTPDFGEAVATPSREAMHEKQRLSFSRFSYRGCIYYLAGVFPAEGARMLLEEDVGLGGGVYTAALLGQSYIDRLRKAGVEFEAKLIDSV